jgi:hypothetical protein
MKPQSRAEEATFALFGLAIVAGSIAALYYTTKLVFTVGFRAIPK